MFDRGHKIYLSCFEADAVLNVDDVADYAPGREQLVIERIGIEIKPTLDGEVVILKLWKVLYRLATPTWRDVPPFVGDPLTVIERHEGVTPGHTHHSIMQLQLQTAERDAPCECVDVGRAFTGPYGPCDKMSSAGNGEAW